MDKLRKIIKYNKQMMLFITIIVIIGIVAGSLFTIMLSISDKETVMSSIQKMADNITNSKYDYLDSIKNVCVGNILSYLIIWILGISIIGVLLIIVILFWKSFTLGFTIGSFILTYNIKGLIMAIFYIFPPLIIDLLVLMYLSSYGIQLSTILGKSILKKKVLNFKNFMNNYFKVLVITITMIVLSCLYEVFVTPFILKYIINILL